MSNIIGWIIAIVFIWFIFNTVGDFGKYEGMSAEEWYYQYSGAESKYRRLHDCVEPYALEDGYISSDDLYYECF